MKIVRIEKHLFEEKIDGITYVSVKKIDVNSCEGCICMDYEHRVHCNAIHDRLHSSTCCSDNNVIFIKK